jgi:hypothetical protein
MPEFTSNTLWYRLGTILRQALSTCQKPSRHCCTSVRWNLAKQRREYTAKISTSLNFHLSNSVPKCHFKECCAVLYHPFCRLVDIINRLPEVYFIDRALQHLARFPLGVGQKLSKPFIIVSIGVIYCLGMRSTRAGIVIPVTTKPGTIEFTVMP